jgi:hypothetical protein
MSKKFNSGGGRQGAHSGGYTCTDLEATRDYKGRTHLTMGCGLVVTVNTFPWDTTANTEATAAFAKVSDAGVFLNLAGSAAGAGYTANYQLFPDTEVIGDAVYFGNATKFGAMSMDMSATVQTYTDDALTWEYYNGSGWVAFTPYDETDGTANDGKRSFGADGFIILSVKDDWALTTIDSQSAYWIRARVTAAVINQTGLTDSKEHLVTSLTNGGTIVNTFGKIGRGMFRFETVSGANADTKIILVNMTTGESSAVKTLTKAVADNDVTDFGVKVNRGDSIVFYCTQEDGTTEFAGGMCELAINHS